MSSAAADRDAVGTFQANGACWAASTQYCDDYKPHAPGPHLPSFRPMHQCGHPAPVAKPLNDVPGQATFGGRSAYAEDYAARAAPLQDHAPIGTCCAARHPQVKFDGTTTYVSAFRGDPTEGSANTGRSQWVMPDAPFDDATEYSQVCGTTPWQSTYRLLPLVI